MNPTKATAAGAEVPASLEDMPRDELLRYARSLGLDPEHDAGVEQLAGRIKARQQLLLELNHEALLDIVVWARRPVRKSASKEQLAREIARIERTNYDSLSTPGLIALTRLRGLPARAGEDSHDIIDRLRKADGFWKRLRRKHRSILRGFVAGLFEETGEELEGEYRFLPEDNSTTSELARNSLRSQIEEYGIVGGIATRLRGAADDYIKQKLDEIEQRIDAKLEQIDKRLAEWRDREVANRLKILRITLIFSVLVAIISLGYKLVSQRVDLSEGSAPPPVSNTTAQ